MTVRYVDSGRNIHLTSYADMVVYDPAGTKKTLCAIRFGGYPEQVGGMAAAISGGGEIEVEAGNEKIILHPLLKQYRRALTHDRDEIYAEATLIAEDETQKSQGKNTKEAQKPKEKDEDFGGQTGLDLPPRNSFIYVAPGDSKALFDAIDRKTGVPLIPAFQDYVLSELKRTGILKPLTVCSASFKFEAWTLKCSGGDRNIIDIIEKGVKTGKITIPGSVSPTGGTPFDVIDSVTGYLSAYGPELAERIKNLFVPLFDPEKDSLSSEVLAVNETIREKAGYSLYDAQLAVAEAVKRQLARGKAGLIVAECGAGKTKIGVTAMAAAMSALQTDQKRRGKGKTFNVVLCPSHIKKKWVREIEESVPDTFGVVVNTITELDKLYAAYAKGSKSCYAVISKEMARDGYMHMPAAIWSKSKKAFVCPDCHSVIEMPIAKDGARYLVDADQFFFKKQNSENHKCQNQDCGASLWTALNPSAARRSDWAKLGDYGFVFRPQAARHLRKVKNAGFAEKIYRIIDDPAGTVTAAGAHRKYPLSTYIKKRYKGRIDGLIVDELHQYNNNSGQGDAMAEMFQAAKKVIGMTGTLINGYSSGIFYLLFRIMPRLMLADGKSYADPMGFIAEYGVVESTYEEIEGDYNANRRTVRRKKSSRQLPGVSPLVYSRFLLEYAAFLSLSDMGRDMPDYEEIPVPLRMPKNVSKPYYELQQTLKNFMQNDKKAAQKILSAYLNLLTVYPDQPYEQPPIMHPVDGTPIVEPPDAADFDTLLPKDEAVLEIAQRKVGAGERVLIYTNWTRLDTQKKLQKLLTDKGCHTEILPAKVKPEKREQWVTDCVDRGVQVLITNPALVETGLDLIAFTTLIFYDMGFKLFTWRQAARRAWRINQRFPRIEIYLLYYQDTMQHKAIRLMAAKLAVAGIIEGGFSEEGLAAMSQCDDMTSQMAKELMLGIKDSVADVSSAFKKMSFIKPGAANYPAVVFTDRPVPIGQAAAGTSRTVEFTFVPAAAAKAVTVFETPDTGPPLPKKARKRPVVDENQITLFEFEKISA
jgi:superfamily II DNA or RNA helicase